MIIQSACGVRPVMDGSSSGMALPTHTDKYNTTTPAIHSTTRLKLRCTHWPIINATTIAAHAGNTALGVLTKALAMTTPNTEFTINSTRNTTTMNSLRVRAPTTASDSAPIDRALWRLLAQSAPES